MEIIDDTVIGDSAVNALNGFGLSAILISGQGTLVEIQTRSRWEAAIGK